MPTMVMIDGTPIDMEDPCAVVGALRSAELTIATGGGVVMTKFGNNEEVRFGSANTEALSSLIQRYERLCEQKSGRRTRYAKRMRFARS